MSRRRQKTQSDYKGLDYSYQQDNQYRQNSNYTPEMPPKLSQPFYGMPDSLQQFQWELQNSLKLHKLQRLQQKQNMPMKAIKDYSKGMQESHTNNYPIRRKNKVLTEYDEAQSERQLQNNKAYQKMNSLQQQLGQIKKQLKNISQTPRPDDKLDKLDRIIEQMIKSRQLDRQLLKKQNVSSPPQFIYNPMPMPYMGYPPQYPPQYPPPYPPQQQYRKQSKNNSYKSTFHKKIVNRARRKLKKYFYAVLFTKFLKSEAKKLANTRKNNFRKFYSQKFNPQILNLKNWLVQSHSYSFPVILEKQNLNLQFWKEKRQVIQKEKRKLLIKIVQLGLQKMKKDCVPLKTSFFTQILQSLCSRGSFVMSRFWSAVQMQNICISQFYGCVRAEQTLQKFLIGMVVFIKVLIFNMLLQPYKFDKINFSKSNESLMRNMYIIASVYYKLAKQVLQEYLQQQRPKYYKLGNWLNVDEQFIIQCCQPLLFNCDYPVEGQWINGMLWNQLQILQMDNDWTTLKSILHDIIQNLHSQMIKRRRQVIKKQKFNLYH